MVRGDSMREVDWRATARQDEILVRHREEERGGHLLILLDRSASMTPQGLCRDRAQRRLALAAAWLALDAGSSVQIMGEHFEGQQGRATLQSFLCALSVPKGNFETLAQQASTRRNVRVLALGDPWVGDAWWGVLHSLASRPRPTHFAALRLAEETHPPSDFLEMRDAETGEALTIDLTTQRVDYDKAFDAHLAQQSARAVEMGVDFTVLDLPENESYFEVLMHLLEGIHVV